ncbi:MAG: DUF4920 domain-containing protein [Planctomycetes bacterium]|nr:DUF4920 domain-containing protein [Planctomycetota bacterium]
MFRCLIGACLVSAVLLSSGCAVRHSDYGDPMRMTAGDEVAVETVLADPEAFDGKFVRVSGKIDSVCEHKGCWLRMAGPGIDDTLFVKFTCPPEEDGRVIPMAAVGHKALVEGTLKITDIDEEERKHLAQDAGKSADDIAKIVGSIRELRFESPAARVFGTFEKKATCPMGAAEREG